MEFRAFTYDDIAPAEDISRLLDFITSNDLWESDAEEFWDKRILNIQTIAKVDVSMARTLKEIATAIRLKIKEHYGLDELYSDTFQIVRWFPGMYQQVHADNPSKEQMNNGLDLSHRDFGAIVYINDDYEGGQTYYPDHDVYITPKSGRLAVHPGTPDHMHGVTEVVGTTRYTISSFWTLTNFSGESKAPFLIQ